MTTPQVADYTAYDINVNISEILKIFEGLKKTCADLSEVKGHYQIAADDVSDVKIGMSSQDGMGVNTSYEQQVRKRINVLSEDIQDKKIKADNIYMLSNQIGEAVKSAYELYKEAEVKLAELFEVPYVFKVDDVNAYVSGNQMMGDMWNDYMGPGAVAVGREGFDMMKSQMQIPFVFANPLTIGIAMYNGYNPIKELYNSAEELVGYVNPKANPFLEYDVYEIYYPNGELMMEDD